METGRIAIAEKLGEYEWEIGGYWRRGTCYGSICWYGSLFSFPGKDDDYTNLANVQGAVQGIEDAGSLAVCLEHLQKLADLPGLLKVFEAIRRPRAEFMMKVARERAVGLFLPDGKEQEQRDNSFKEHQIDLTDKNWDGKCSDDPPEGGLLSPLYAGYMFGFDIMDHVS
jgi:hypothetical protein